MASRIAVTVLGLVVWLTTLVVTSPASAADEKPWARGVSPAEQTIARALLADGNRLFEESQYVPALEKYRQALPHWDHPLIRYNIAVCLVNLDQSVEAYDNLVRSLAFGEAPLGAEIHARALTYRKLLLGQLAEVTVKCNEPGAVVTLDGKPLFTAPGTVERRVDPGPHQVVVTKPGFVTLSHELVLLPNRPTVEDLQPVVQGVAVFRRRWPQWKPWVVFGVGLAVAAAGIPLELVGRARLDDYDAKIASVCGAGCPSVPPEAQAQLDRANGLHAGAITSFAVGGALLVAGATLLILNAPRAVSDDAPARKTVSWSPGLSIGPGYGGASVAGAF